MNIMYKINNSLFLSSFILTRKTREKFCPTIVKHSTNIIFTSLSKNLTLHALVCYYKCFTKTFPRILLLASTSTFTRRVSSSP